MILLQKKIINFDILSSIKIDNSEIISNGNKEEENNIILRAKSKSKNFDYLEHLIAYISFEDLEKYIHFLNNKLNYFVRLRQPFHYLL